jgi:hypothetical protein
MNNKDVWLTFAILVIALILAFTIVTILQKQKSTDALQESARLQAIDRLLSKGATKAAEESIIKLAAKDLSAASYIRLIKRTWQISASTDSYELYNRVTAAAAKAYPARSDVKALRVYGFLRSGKQSEAADILASSEIETEKWPKISAEAGLYFQDSTKPEAYTLSQQSAPDEFLRMYTQTGSYGFLLDGLLLMLQQGKIDSAYATAAEEKALSELPTEFVFQLFFDAEYWQEAEKVLTQHPQIYSKTEYLLLSADLLMYRRRFNQATEVYKSVLESTSELSTYLKSRALLNLVYIYEKLDQPAPANIMKMITQVSIEDPENSALLFAGYFLAHEDTAKAQELLNVSASSGEQSMLRQIIAEETNTTVNPERYKSLLWRLVYRTEEAKYAQFLAWFLIGIEDIEGLQSLIQHSQQTFGTQGWIQFYQGILQMYARNYETAAEQFKTGYNSAKKWEYLYNAALCYSAADNINAALDELKAAESVVSPQSAARAVIMTQQIELLIHSGRYKEAQKLFAIFEKRFPDNMSAGLLRSLLEARASD